MKNALLFILITSLFAFCSKEISGPDETVDHMGVLDVQATLNTVSDITPTLQTVIWLEDENGGFIRTLFISDWLAWSGYHHKFVCPDWNEKSNWQDVPEEEFDAVTAATPRPGERTFSFDLDQLGQAVGDYIVNMETHIENEYNVRFSAPMALKGKAVSTSPAPEFVPNAHPTASDLVSNVTFRYRFEESK